MLLEFMLKKIAGFFMHLFVSKFCILTWSIVDSCVQTLQTDPKIKMMFIGISYVISFLPLSTIFISIVYAAPDLFIEPSLFHIFLILISPAIVYNGYFSFQNSLSIKWLALH
jgi:hypothetical protein